MNTGIKRLIKEKLKVLKELHIKLTDEEIAYIKSLKTESDLDHYAHTIIMRDTFKK